MDEIGPDELREAVREAGQDDNRLFEVILKNPDGFRQLVKAMREEAEEIARFREQLDAL